MSDKKPNEQDDPKQVFDDVGIVILKHDWERTGYVSNTLPPPENPHGKPEEKKEEK
jgi:hypothetical protein